MKFFFLDIWTEQDDHNTDDTGGARYDAGFYQKNDHDAISDSAVDDNFKETQS